jgi:hypothetical protein
MIHHTRVPWVLHIHMRMRLLNRLTAVAHGTICSESEPSLDTSTLELRLPIYCKKVCTISISSHVTVRYPDARILCIYCSGGTSLLCSLDTLCSSPSLSAHVRLLDCSTLSGHYTTGNLEEGCLPPEPIPISYSEPCRPQAYPPTPQPLIQLRQPYHILILT